MNRPQARLLLSMVALVASGFVVLAVAGCSSGGSSATSTDDSKMLVGKTWRATEIDGKATLPADSGNEATAVFAAGKLVGSGTVNRFTATYETSSGNKITISQPAATLMAGAPDAMAQEDAYFAALGKAKKFAVTSDSLELQDAKGAALVKYEAVEPTTLTGTEWSAVAYNNGKDALQSLAASSAITATFGTDGTLSGNASVNQYNTTYTTTGKDSMSVNAQIVTTMMAGPDDLMAQEAAYLAALPKTATYVIEGKELWLRDETGAAVAMYIAK